MFALSVSTFSLILRSAFAGHQASMFLYNDKSNNVLSKKALDRIVFTYLSLPDESKQASLLIHHEDGASHKMFHYNFTMIRCMWGCDMTIEDKVQVFRGMSDWLTAHNETLKGNFVDTDDYLAWNIAQYTEGEHHFD